MATQQHLTPEDFLRLAQPMRQQYHERIARIVDQRKGRLRELGITCTAMHVTRYIRETLELDFLYDHYRPGTIVSYLGVSVMVEHIDGDWKKRLTVYGKTGGRNKLLDIEITQSVAEALVWKQYLENN